MQSTKPIIYQLFPRLFTNTCENCIPNGTIKENGSGKMNHIDSKVLESIKKLGVTHVWYTGVLEHAQATTYPGIPADNPYVVKGKAGSPYAIKDYFDIDPDIAENTIERISEFKALIERTHQSGLQAIIDFVPNHVARQYHSDAKPEGVEDFGVNDDTNAWFEPNNNFYYMPEEFSPCFSIGEGKNRYIENPAKATGNDCFSAHPGIYDWYETVKLNYGVDYRNHTWHFSPIPSTWKKMYQIIEYWIGMGVDGFRCDMAFMVPISFWNWMIPQIKEKYPHVIFIAELYDANIYRRYLFDGHFDYLYDKVNLYDTLRAITCGYASASSLTRCWQEVDGVGNRMLNFLENHDEQRIASLQFADNAFKGIPALIVSASISAGPFLLYSGQELGEKAEDAEGYSGKDGRTTIFDYWSIPSVRRWYNNGKCDGKKSSAEEKQIRKIYSKILNTCNKEVAIREGGFFDLMYVNYGNLNPDKQYAYIRYSEDNTILVVVNFDDNDTEVNISIPTHAFDCIGIDEGTYSGKELIHNEQSTFDISCSSTISIKIKANDGVMWKLSKSKSSRIVKKS